MAYKSQSTALMQGIEIKSKDLQINKNEDSLLGRGGYGCVYIGKYKGRSVAVKMLSDSGDIPKTQRNDLRREAKRLRAVCEHPFILNLIGVVMETDNYSIVLEYMHFGTSCSFIKNYMVKVPVRIQFAYQIISAMAYLHSRIPPMKHLDLKAENVLINNNFVAKISDFGLSEWKTVTMAFSKTPLSGKGPRCGTLSHIPPEVFKDINKKGAMEEDVYAFGITMWEIFSGQTPYANCGDKEELIRGAVLNNQRPDLNALVEGCPNEIQSMIQVSWDHNQVFRPTFRDLEEKIEPVYNRIRDTLPDHFKFIRAQIVTMHEEDPEEYEEHLLCTEHWSYGLSNGQRPELSNGQRSELSNGHRSELFNGQRPELSNGQRSELSNGQESPGIESFDAKPSTHDGSPNIELGDENRQIQNDAQVIDSVADLLLNLSVSNPGLYQSLLRNPEALQNIALQDARNDLTDEGKDTKSTEQAVGGYQGNVNFPARIQTNGNEASNHGNSQTLVQRLSDHDNSQTLVQKLSERSDDPDSKVPRQTGYAAVRPRLQTVQPQMANGKSDQDGLRNNTLEQVPINETNLAGNPSVKQRNNNPEQVGLSGFVSVVNKQYTPGSQLSHPHGPVAQPASTVIRNEPVANDNAQGEGPSVAGQGRNVEGQGRNMQGLSIQGQGRSVEEGDDNDDMLFQGDDGVQKLLLNLSESNPSLYLSLMKNPGAIQNIARAVNGGQFKLETRPSNRPPNSCTREVTQSGGTQFLTQLSVDQFSDKNTNGQNQQGSRVDQQQQASPLPGSQYQQTTNLGTTRNTVRMLPAPDRNFPPTQSNVHQPAGATGHGLTSQTQVTPPVHLTEKKLPRQPVMGNVGQLRPVMQDDRLSQLQQKQLFGQPTAHTAPYNQIPPGRQSISPAFQQPRIGHLAQQFITGTGPGQTFVTSDPRQAVFGQPMNQGQGQASYMQPPQMTMGPAQSGLQPAKPVQGQVPMGPAASDLRPNVAGATQQNAPAMRHASPLEAGDQIRHGESSNRSNQQSTNQTNTGVPEPNAEETSEPHTGGRRKQPVTIFHKHAGGGVTTIKMDPDHEFPPNFQIGNKNVMVVNDGGSRKKSEKKKKKEKCRRSQLTASTAELSMDHIDMVSIEIGKDWKRLCRQLDMTEADIEHLQFDFYTSGLYEMTYQGIQKWIQRNGSAANVRSMAEALWEIDRDDIALKLR